jgi:pimeloyl-ACP methyl ester carboxylesterase
LPQVRKTATLLETKTKFEANPMSGEAIVMIPHMLCDARLFAPQINALSRTRAVMVAPNANGERLEEIASAILMAAPQKFALAGAGFGGVIALEIMRRAAERVTRLALISTNTHQDTPEAAAAREPRIVAARAGRWDDVLREEVALDRLAKSDRSAEVGRSLLDMARDAGPEVYVRQARALLRRRDIQPTIRAIKQPTLVLCGAQDPQSPVKRHAFLAELLPNARLATLENAGHMPSLEAPAEVTQALMSWAEGG